MTPAATRLMLVALLCASLPAERLAGQTTEVERAAALERTAGRLAGEGVTGRLVERTPGSYEFAPVDEPLALPVVNPEQVAASAVGPVLRAYGTLDPDGDLLLRDYRVDLAPATASAAPPGPLQQELDRALRGFAATVDAAIQPDAVARAPEIGPARAQTRRAGTSARALSAESRTVVDEIADVYARAVEAGDADARSAAVRSYVMIRQVEKAIYDTYDNYPPWNYARIFRNANAVVAIGAPEASQAICSGVLIGQDLVLTAGHCFKSDLPDELEVWFDYVQDEEGPRPPKRRPITELVAPTRDRQIAFFAQEFDRDLYDYAIVRFEQGDDPDGLLPRVEAASCKLEPPEAPSGDAAPEARAQWQDLREEWDARCVRQPQCLRDVRIRRGRPLYVVGYPKGAHETVHDSGRVYLPHEVTVAEFNDLKLEIEADYLDHPEREQIVAEFVSSYVPREQRHILEDVRYGGQPRMGIVADTFRGNSGSPVYERDKHCLIGMLVGGAEDRGERLLASWQHHESVLPVSAILDDLRRHPETEALIDEGRLTVR